MAGVALGGVNGGSSCATLNSVGVQGLTVSQTHSLGCLDGLGWLEDLEFLFFLRSVFCFWSGSWIQP